MTTSEAVAPPTRRPVTQPITPPGRVVRLRSDIRKAGFQVERGQVVRIIKDPLLRGFGHSGFRFGGGGSELLAKLCGPGGFEAAVAEVLDRVKAGNRETAEQLVGAFMARLDDWGLLDTAVARRMVALKTRELRSYPPAAVAGLMYPASRQELRALLDELAAECPPVPDLACRVKGMIVPHVPLRVSGSLAVGPQSYLTARNWPKLFIILGPLHVYERDEFAISRAPSPRRQVRWRRIPSRLRCS